MRAYTMVIFFCAISVLAATGSVSAAPASAETVFNQANLAMTSGDDAKAIQLYYGLAEGYPDFNKYRDDVLFRLGTLLYKAERYDEAEKIFSMLAARNKKYKDIDKVYEKLINIYAEVMKDTVRAQKIRNLYLSQFGRTPVLNAIDTTMTILKYDEKKGAQLLSIDPQYITAGSMTEVKAFDREFFPVRNYIQTQAVSADKKLVIERTVTAAGSYLYLKDADGKIIKKINGSRNGEAPVWSWNGKFAAFTVKTGASRVIKIFNILKGTVKQVFKGKDIEPLACFSPDSSKLMFVYMGNPWIIETNGNNISLVGRVKLKDVLMTAWSKYGDKVLFVQDGKEIYDVLELERKSMDIIEKK